MIRSIEPGKVIKWVVVYLFFVTLEVSIHHIVTVFTFYSYFLCLVASVINIEYLIPYVLDKRHIVVYAISVVLIIAICSMGKLIYLAITPSGTRLDYSFIYLVFPTVLMVGSTMSFHLALGWTEARKRVIETEKELLKSNLSVLRTQLNPHFFFNSINNIYHLIDIDKEASKEAIVKMSELLRFQLDECQKEFIQLDQELMFLRNYIDFESLRLGEEVVVSFNHSVQSDSKMPPLLLMPFVENSFKHVSRRYKMNKITIVLTSGDFELEFLCTNTVDYSGTENPNVRSGIGIRNVKKRLELLYPGTHRLAIQNAANEYTVRLVLPCRRDA